MDKFAPISDQLSKLCDGFGLKFESRGFGNDYDQKNSIFNFSIDDYQFSSHILTKDGDCFDLIFHSKIGQVEMIDETTFSFHVSKAAIMLVLEEKTDKLLRKIVGLT